MWRATAVAPTGQDRAQSFAQLRSRRHHAEALGRQEPLVTVGDHGIDAEGVEAVGKHAEALDGVEDHDDATSFGGLGNLGDRRDPTGVECHPGQRQQLHRRFEQGDHVRRFHHPAGGREAADGDATVGQREPGRDVGGELLLADEHGVAGAPREALGDQREPFRRRADEGDVVAATPDQLGRPRADSHLTLAPRLPVMRAARLLLGDPNAHRLGHRTRQGCDGGMVEVEAVLADRELGKPAGEIDRHGSKYSFLQSRGGTREAFAPTRDNMCGIAGFAGSREEQGSDLVGRMLGALVHRGPDAAGVRAGETWGIGARRLAIIDLVTGDQPVSNERGDVHAVLNGEIYNYLELRKELVARGHRLRSTGDSEVLVHLWEECGPDMIGRLRGMFALAVVDDRSRTFFLARDRVGKKPLYWTRQGRKLLFASELKALREALSGRPEVDLDGLAAYLAFGFVPEGQCILRGIEKLPPGHWLSLDMLTGEVRQRRYWRLELAPDESIGFTDAVQEVLALLDEAVRLRLRSDVPLAVFLSGGLDSGMVAALAARHHEGLRAITVRMADATSETELARATAERAGIELDELTIDASEGLALLPRLAEVFDEPLADSSTIPTLLISMRARERATVVLNGDGGDEVLAGYRRFLAARVSGWPLAGFWGPGLAALLPVARDTADRLARGFRAGDRSYLSWGPIKLTPDEVADLIGCRPGATSAVEAILQTAGRAAPADLLRRLELEFFLPGDLLVKMDRATMAASIEARSPFLDHVLIERVARYPTGLLLRGLRTKSVLRAAGVGLLPPEVRRAPKRGFEVPLEAWLSGPWAAEVNALVEDPFARLRRFVPGSKLAKWAGWRRMPGRRRAVRAVFTLLTLEHWLRRWT